MRRCACGYPERYHHPVTLRCPLLERGTFREPEPEPKILMWGLVVPAPAATKERAPEDRVPRREAMKLEEIAPAALKVGKKAATAGVDVVPYFRELHDGTWWTILRMEHGEFRAIAVWRRPAGGTWSFRAAAVDRVPVGAKRLGELLSELGE